MTFMLIDDLLVYCFCFCTRNETTICAEVSRNWNHFSKSKSVTHYLRQFSPMFKFHKEWLFPFGFNEFPDHFCVFDRQLFQFGSGSIIQVFSENREWVENVVLQVSVDDLVRLRFLVHSHYYLVAFHDCVFIYSRKGTLLFRWSKNAHLRIKEVFIDCVLCLLCRGRYKYEIVWYSLEGSLLQKSCVLECYDMRNDWFCVGNFARNIFVLIDQGDRCGDKSTMVKEDSVLVYSPEGKLVNQWIWRDLLPFKNNVDIFIGCAWYISSFPPNFIFIWTTNVVFIFSEKGTFINCFSLKGTKCFMDAVTFDMYFIGAQNGKVFRLM